MNLGFSRARAGTCTAEVDLVTLESLASILQCELFLGEPAGRAAVRAQAVHARVLLQTKLLLDHRGDNASLPAGVEVQISATALLPSGRLQCSDDRRNNGIQDLHSAGNLA